MSLVFGGVHGHMYMYTTYALRASPGGVMEAFEFICCILST
jgi:hypothetical protein